MLRAVVALGIEIERSPDVDVGTRHLKARRQDAHDRVALAVEENGSPDDPRIHRELPSPEIAADYDASASRGLVVSDERPPRDGPHAEHRKKVAGDAKPFELFRLTDARERGFPEAVRRHHLQRSRGLAPHE